MTQADRSLAANPSHVFDKDGGETRPAREREAELKLPHERDESASEQSSSTPSHVDVGEQAHDDANSVRRDTDRGEVTDAVYNQNFERSPDKPRP